MDPPAPFPVIYGAAANKQPFRYRWHNITFFPRAGKIKANEPSPDQSDLVRSCASPRPIPCFNTSLFEIVRLDFDKQAALQP